MTTKIISRFLFEKFSIETLRRGICSSLLESEEMFVSFVNPLNLNVEKRSVVIINFNKKIFENTVLVFENDKITIADFRGKRKDFLSFISKKTIISIFNDFFDKIDFSFLPLSKLAIRELQQLLKISDFFTSEDNYHMGKFYAEYWSGEKKVMPSNDIVRVFEPRFYSKIVRVMLLFLINKKIALGELELATELPRRER